MIGASKEVSPPLPEPCQLSSPLIYTPSQLPWLIIGLCCQLANEKCEALSQSAPQQEFCRMCKSTVG